MSEEYENQDGNGESKAFEKVIKSFKRYQLQEEQQMQAAKCKHVRDMWHVLGWA